MTSIPPPGYAPPDEQPLEDRPQPGTAAETRPKGRAGWPPWTAWAAFLAGFGLAIFGGLIIALVSAATGASLSKPPPGVNIAGLFLQNIALIAAALLFAHMSGRPAPGDFGLRRSPVGRSIGLAVAVWLAFIAFSAIWAVALSLDERQTLPDVLGIEGSALNLVLVVILITVVAPLGEEFLFRGYFFGALRNWRGFLPAAIITGLVFGAIHLASSPVGLTVPLAIFGFGLCLLYQWTGSLYPCIALHAANNALALGLMQKWSWEIIPTAVGAVVVSLGLAALLARVLAGRSLGPVGPLEMSAAAPGP